MEPTEQLEALLVLAREAELEVRVVGPRVRGEGDSPPVSGLCRVRGRVWVVLSAVDPLEAQLEVLAGALRENASELIETRYLPPAVRARLGGPASPSDGSA